MSGGPTAAPSGVAVSLRAVSHTALASRALCNGMGLGERLYEGAVPCHGAEGSAPLMARSTSRARPGPVWGGLSCWAGGVGSRGTRGKSGRELRPAKQRRPGTARGAAFRPGMDSEAHRRSLTICFYACPSVSVWLVEVPTAVGSRFARTTVLFWFILLPFGVPWVLGACVW